MSKDCKNNIFEKISVETIKNMSKAELVKAGIIGVASLTVVGGAINAVTAPSNELPPLEPPIEEEWEEDTYTGENKINWSIPEGGLPSEEEQKYMTQKNPSAAELGDPNGIPEEYHPMSFEEYLAENGYDSPQWIDNDDIFSTYVRSASNGQLNLDLFHPSVQGNVTMNSDYGFYEGKTFTVTNGFIADPGVGTEAYERGSNYDYSYLKEYAPHLSLDNATMSAYNAYGLYNVVVWFEYEENGNVYEGNLKGVYITDGDECYFLDAFIEYGL